MPRSTVIVATTHLFLLMSIIEEAHAKARRRLTYAPQTRGLRAGS